ncbi:nuclear transport factor 2 family protein [Raoultella sp. T31]|uniref:nuclear transport factor 2 family protein n=1 Tax=Raoultella sp. T31 TaxID=2054594 RepID=UPI000C286287|nr:nuclear transport factor 2 family protein [Raoultella sp. T31]
MNNIADKIEIKELNAKYNFSVDESDAESWASCFTPDGVFNALLPGKSPRGTQELIDFVEVVAESFGQMHHLTTNEIIIIEGNKAQQKCYLQFIYKKNGLTQGGICIYNDWLEKENGKWKCSRRDVIYKTKFIDIYDEIK